MNPNQSNLIIIQPVANGYIVTMPFEMKFSEADPMLGQSEISERNEHQHIFSTWSEVVQFLIAQGNAKFSF